MIPEVGEVRLTHHIPLRTPDTINEIAGQSRFKHGADILPIMTRFQEYQVIGRKLPTKTDTIPKLYRMRIFAPNEVVAKSRFWYFLRQLKKAKAATGEIVAVHKISEKKPLKVKNIGVWVRYDSRSGTHNMYREMRDMSRAAAIDKLYEDLASKHRARFRSIQVLRVQEIEKTAQVKRPYIRQLLQKGLRFPLPHRLTKKYTTFAAHRPKTF
ncbi:60S ribosomal protein L20 [Tulasnella sp. JGI-2019a]|nr:60S ribosomal protein L20 [Tulasnella sp. JGI-2019a]